MLRDKTKSINSTIYQFFRELRQLNIVPYGLSSVLGIFTLIILFTNITAKTEVIVTETSILATVNEDTIYVKDIDKLIIDFHRQKGGSHLKQFDTKKLFNKKINDLLLIQEAYFLELDKEEWLINEVEEYQVDKAIALFLHDKYKPDLEVDSTEILNYFNKYYSRMLLRTISILTEEEAQAIVKSIRAGADMDSIAKELSLDTHRLKGGLRNFSYYGDIEDILRIQGDKLKIGEVSDPFPYRNVYSIVRLEKLAEPNPDDLPDLTRKISSVLRHWKNETASTNFFDSLFNLFPVMEDTSILGLIIADSSKLFTKDFTKGVDKIALSGLQGYSMNDEQLRNIISYGAMNTANDPFDSIYTRGIKKAKIELTLKSAVKVTGYLEKKEITQLSNHFLDSNLIEIYLKQTILPKISIEAEDINEYFQSHLDDFRLQSKYQFNRIIFNEDSLAQAAYKRIQEGANFHFAASQFDGQLSTTDENSEWLGLGTFPNYLQEKILLTGIGECIAPAAISEGWLLLQLKAIKKGDVRPIQEVSTDIRSILFAQKFGELMDKTINLLKANSNIWLNDTIIDKYFGNKKPITKDKM